MHKDIIAVTVTDFKTTLEVAAWIVKKKTNAFTSDCRPYRNRLNCDDWCFVWNKEAKSMCKA